MDQTTLYVMGVIFLATLVRSAFGFGEALVAVPLLALRLPVGVAVPLAVLTSVLVAAVIVAQDWREVHFFSAGWLVASTMVGIPLGLWLLTSVDERVVKSVLAVLIIVFSGYCLMTPAPPHLQVDRKRWLLLFGFVAGVLGGAYGMNGPPLVIYGSLRRWTPQHFRATLQAYFFPASLVSVAGYWLASLLSPAVGRYFLLGLPGTFVAIVVGRAINRRMRGQSFLLYVHAGLIVIAVTLLYRAVR